MIWLWIGLALAHEPGGCPPLSALRSALSSSALPKPLRPCLEAIAPRSSGVRRLLWRDRLFREGLTASVERAVMRWARVETRAESLIETAEFLQRRSPEWSRAVLVFARERLEATPWSVGWTRLEVRYHEVSAALGVSSAPVQPALSIEVEGCDDLGALLAGVYYGGVYASDRDCVLRRVEALSGEARVRMSQLAWQLALSYAAGAPTGEAELVVVRRRLDALERGR